MSMAMSRYGSVSKSVPPPDVVVLAGGSGRRMGGVDKPSLYVGRSTLLDRVLSAVPDEARVVVVGPFRPVSRSVRWTQEEPAGRGPVAALAAGLELVEAPRVLLLAADLPFLNAATVQAVVAAVRWDGAVLVDDTGKDQYLCSAWRSSALRRADLSGSRLKDVVAQLCVDRVSVPVPAGAPRPWDDCDTPSQLRAARAIA
jgi:molybdopterin-guanine dinucleotide biosynthesis protein A